MVMIHQSLRIADACCNQPVCVPLLCPSVLQLLQLALLPLHVWLGRSGLHAAPSYTPLLCFCRLPPVPRTCLASQAQRHFAGDRRLLIVYTQTSAAATQVLCASDASHEKVDPVAAPEGVPNGERVMVSG